jgi:LysM repeat protein
MPERRTLGSIAALAALVVLGTACADGDVGGPTAATITILPQSYQTRPGPTEVGQTTTLPPVDGRAQQEQEHVVQDGEYPSNIANDFDISLSELLEYNDLELVNGQVPDFPAAGETVRIPPGALIPELEEAEDEEPTDSSSTTTTLNARPSAGSTTSLGDECTPGSYTITAQDTTRLKVAQRFDVTVEALDAANAATNGYSAFFPGLKIVIPPAAGC